MRIHTLCGLIALVALGSQTVQASPTDYLSRGSAINDAFAQLAAHGFLGNAHGPTDFLWETQHTRGELAHLLETNLLSDTDLTSKAEDSPSAAAFAQVLVELRPELESDQVDVDALLSQTKEHAASFGALLQPEARIRAGGDRSPGTNGTGIYRVTAMDRLSASSSLTLSLSNWYEEWRRNFDTDVPRHGYSPVNEAYFEVQGRHGLTLDIGRLYDRWGPGYYGDMMLSDNSPAFDQIRLAFPFSLGSALGRNYRYTQMAGIFSEGGQQKVLEARRVEYAFNRQWNADIGEAFKSSRLGSLIVTPFPFNTVSANFGKILPGVNVDNIDTHFNYDVNFSLSYTPSEQFRAYSQFNIDDLKSPLGKHSKVVPRKIGYLIGMAAQPFEGTDVTAEYYFSDPTFNTYRTHEALWQHGDLQDIGYPGGPNARELFLRVSQRVTPRLNLALEGRDRRRHDDSFPAPTSRDLAAFASYTLNTRQGITLSYHDYRQDPFPIAPGVPIGNGFQPIDEGNYGQRLRIKQVDVSYQFYF